MANKRAQRGAPTSATCALPSCNRQVRYENPDFPYCRDHRGMNRSSSSMVPTSVSRSALDSTREMLYNPHKTALSRAMTTASILASTSKFPFALSAHVYSTWAKNLKGASIDSPSDMMSRRDDLLDAVGSRMERDGMEVDTLSCSGGHLIIPEQGNTACRDHEVLLVSRDGDEMIIDPAAAAPLDGLVESVSKTFGSGESTCGDGIYMAPLFEYAGFSSVSFSSITRGEDVLWEVRPVSEDNSVDVERNLAAKNPPVYPPVIYRASPEMDPVDDPDEGETDKLDALLDDDDEPNIEDLRREAMERRGER